MTSRHWIVGFLAAALATSGAAAAVADHPLATAEDLNTLHADPAARQGVLANGLRYVVMRNASPAGGVSLRLAIDVGGREESAAQHGAAHFVEHLAFGNGDNAHELALEQVFAQAGVAFGRDINAETGLFSTVYRLDLPKADPAALGLALAWLRAVADGARFTQAAVDRERGVIQAEREAGQGPAAEAEGQLAAFHTPDLRAILSTIGTEASLRALDASALREFYRAWYRPQNAVLVVVGDVDPRDLETRLGKAFGDWAGQGPAPVRAAPERPSLTRGEASLALAEPHLTTEIRVCRVRGPDAEGPDDVARLRRRLLTRLWTSLVNIQLETSTLQSRPPYLQARFEVDDELRDARITCLNVMPLDERWAPALAAAQAELARFLAHGPTQDDLDDRVVAMRARLRGERDQARTRDSINLANGFAQKALAKEIILSPNEAFFAFDAAVETLTPEDVRQAFAQDWSGAGPLLSIWAPRPPSAEALKAAWDEDAARPAPPAAAAARAPGWAYADFGRSGRVRTRAVLKDPDFVRLVYSNGVVLNFKPTDFKKDDVEIRVRFGAGRREIAGDDLFAAFLGAGLLPSGGLGRHGLSDINRLFGEKAWQVQLSVVNDAFVLHGETNAASLRAELQILAAYLSDPGFRAEVDPRIPTAVEAAYRESLNHPSIALSLALAEAIAPGSPATLPPRAQATALRMADFQRILKPALTEAPLEITVVGDIEEGTASDLVGQTLGALPQRTAGPRERPSTWFLRFPDHPPTVIRATLGGSGRDDVVGLYWPLFVASPERRREEMALRVLAGVMSDDLRHRVREELGKSYSPGAGTVMPDHADQGYLEATIATAPADVEAMIAETRRVAARLATTDVTPEALEAARRPLLADYAARSGRNDGWVAALSGSSISREGLDAWRTEPDLLAKVTVQDLREAAARWLTRPPIVVIASPGPDATAPGVPAGQ
jgi:zinc protease